MDEEYDDMPMRLSMRKTHGKYYYYNDYYGHYDKKNHTWLHNFLEHSVGKRFNYIYKKICEKFRKAKNFYLRKEFKDEFNAHGDYYVDENGIIQTSRKPGYKWTYRVNRLEPRCIITTSSQHHFKDALNTIRRISEKTYNKIIKGEILTKLDLYLIEKYIYTDPYYKYHEDEVKIVTNEEECMTCYQNDRNLREKLKAIRVADEKENKELERFKAK
jgi:uncharacterized protein YifE (UPF0438 family)